MVDPLPLRAKRILCRVLGHRWSPKSKVSVDPRYTGYLEHSFCERCHHEEIVQVPQ